MKTPPSNVSDSQSFSGNTNNAPIDIEGSSQTLIRIPMPHDVPRAYWKLSGVTAMEIYKIAGSIKSGKPFR